MFSRSCSKINVKTNDCQKHREHQKQQVTAERSVKYNIQPRSNRVFILAEKPRNMTEVCQLPQAPGPCRAAMPQWLLQP